MHMRGHVRAILVRWVHHVRSCELPAGRLPQLMYGSLLPIQRWMKSTYP